MNRENIELIETVELLVRNTRIFKVILWISQASKFVAQRIIININS